jgi:hypothetical protein
MLKDPAFVDDIKKKRFELDPISGEELDAMVKEIMTQPPEIIDRLKKLLG